MNINGWQELLCMNNLKEITKEAMQKNLDADVFSIIYKGQKLWVKKARRTGSNTFHKWAYKLIKDPIIVPVNDKSPQEAIHYEASKIQQLHDLGIHVPKVIDITDNYFIMEDRGPTINDLMHNNLVNDPMALFEKVVTQLSILHNKNAFHGSSQIKNFTYQTEKDAVFFIDFEESFDEHINIEDLQFRDLMLFLLSLSRLRIPLDYAPLLNTYIRLTGKKDIHQRLRTLTAKVSFLMRIMHYKSIWNLLDNDTKGIYTLLQQIRQIPSTKE